MLTRSLCCHGLLSWWNQRSIDPLDKGSAARSWPTAAEFDNAVSLITHLNERVVAAQPTSENDPGAANGYWCIPAGHRLRQ